MGGERGVSQDFPDEHYWGIIDWIIFGFKSFLVLTSSMTVFVTHLMGRELAIMTYSRSNQQGMVSHRGLSTQA